MNTFERELARRWAPVHWQGVGDRDDPRYDLIAPVNFDGNWKTIGNWDSAAGCKLLPLAYYSVVESETHWYLLYAFFHPRDWATGLGTIYDQHENDMEGVLLIVEKPGPLSPTVAHGQLLGMITLAHNHFYSYSNVLEGHREDLDGPLFVTAERTGQSRPCTRQEAKGHGCYGLLPSDSREWSNLGKPLEIDARVARKAFDFPEGRGIRYFLGADPQHATASGRVTVVDCDYDIEDVFDPAGFWQQQCGPVDEPFTADRKKIAGKKHGENKASPPWSWDDKDDASSMSAGIIANDPARLAYHYFKGFSTFSHTYVRNPYTEPLYCSGGVPGPGMAMRAGDAAAARSRVLRMSPTALRKELRHAVDRDERQRIAIELIWEARHDARFRGRLAAAANDTLKDATTRSRRSAGADTAEQLHMAIPAIRTLGELDVRSSRTKLVQLLETSTDRDVLLAAMESLAKMAPGSTRGLKCALTGLFTYGDPHVRAAAARLYTDSWATRHPKPLAALVADPSSEVRAAALEGLGRSGRPDFKRDLTRARKDEHEHAYVRGVADRALTLQASDRTRRRRARELGLMGIAGDTARVGGAPTGGITETPLSAEQYNRFSLARAMRK